MTTNSDPHPIDKQAPDSAQGEQQPENRSRLAGVTTSAAAMFALAFVAAVAALLVIWLLARPISLVLGGIIIAQALSPLVDRLARWMARSLAIAAVYISLLGLLGLLGWIIVPALVEQGQDLVDRAPSLYEGALAWLTQYEVFDGRLTTDNIQEQVTGQIGQFGSTLVNLPLIIISTLFETLLVVIVSVYWIIAGPTLRSFTLSLFPEERQARVSSVMSEMGQTMGGYVRGIAINSSLLGVVAFIGLSLIGVQYALVLALIAAVLDIVPIIGPIVASVPIVGVALLDSPTTALITLVFWVAVQQLESYVTLPFIMHYQADVPPLLVLLAVFGGESVGGILGALVAIPLAGALRIFVIRVVAPAIRRWTGAIDGDLVGPPQPPPGQAVSVRREGE
jgi:predicted PurR-regulated permease PerM